MNGRQNSDAVDDLLYERFPYREKFKEGLRSIGRTFPSFPWAILVRIADGDQVAERYRFEGEHFGFPGSGKRLESEGVDISGWRATRLRSPRLVI